MQTILRRNNMERVMVRKVRLYGPKSYGILLPKLWIEDNGLKPNDEIIIYREDDRLILKKREGNE